MRRREEPLCCLQTRFVAAVFDISEHAVSQGDGVKVHTPFDFLKDAQMVNIGDCLMSTPPSKGWRGMPFF